MNNWIPTSEKLPEKKTKYAICLNNNLDTPALGEFMGTSWAVWHQKQLSHYKCNVVFPRKPKVTHWKPFNDRC